MKNLFKQILFGAALLVSMSMFVGCDMMTNDEIEKLINDKLNENSSNATADATPPVELAGTTWFSYEEWTRSDYDEDLGEYIEYEVYDENFLHFTETTITYSGKRYKKEDDSLIDEWEEELGEYFVQGNIIIINPNDWEMDPLSICYIPKEDCIIWGEMEIKFYRVEE